MGLFSKKATTPQAAPSQYVAPTVVPLQVLDESEAGSRKSMDGPDIEMTIDRTIDSRGHNSSVTGKMANATTDNLDFVGLPANLPPANIHRDDPTIESYGDNDTATFRTDYTGGPTVKTLGSDDSAIDSAFTITRRGQYLTMNGFANGHLMRWKFAAEEGPAFIRFPALLLALAVIGTTVYPLVTDSSYWKLSTLICAVHTCVLASLIFVLEGRVIVGTRAPTGLRARTRAVVTRYLNLFRLLWGRGVLYIFVGSMSMTIDHPYSDYAGLALMVYGVLAILSGAHSAYNLDKMKSSLTDESFLWANFDVYDRDHDNYIDLNAFAELLYDLGLEFDDAYTFKAFSQINGDVGGTISFEQFRDWWVVTQTRGRTLRHQS